MSGITITPERLALFRKYDGDRYNKKIEGLFAFRGRHFKNRLRELNISRDESRVSSLEFETNRKTILGQKDAALHELQTQKEVELGEIRRREREIGKRYRA